MPGPIKRRISFPADAVLHAVVQEGDMVELHRLLNQHDEDININQRNHMGLTALHHSVLTNNIDAAKLLLCQGADVNIQDSNGYTPLHAAAGGGFLYIATMLIAFGADIFIQTHDGDYPVDLCKGPALSELLVHEMCKENHKRTFWRFLCLHQLKELLYLLKNKLKQFVFFVGVIVKYSVERCTDAGHSLIARYVVGSIGPTARDKVE